MKKINLIGKNFGLLKVVSQADNVETLSKSSVAWNCLCECGNKVIITTSHLNSGNTKSCGHLKTQEKTIEFKKKLSDTLRKYEPKIASARRIWKSYKYNGDDECKLTFDHFYNLSQMNCTYCGTPPSNNFNYRSRINGEFIYNGMDRVDSSKSHTDENCVPCCLICNRAKNNRTLEDFKKYINNLKINIPNFQYKEITFVNNNYIKTSIRTVYRIYKDGDLSLENFYTISQLPCFYCGAEKSNLTNYARTDKKSSQKAIEQADFKYNGIDRINSNKPHNLDNVVPCCRWCNFAKGKLSLEKFQSWIKLIKEKAQD